MTTSSAKATLRDQWQAMMTIPIYKSIFKTAWGDLYIRDNGYFFNGRRVPPEIVEKFQREATAEGLKMFSDLHNIAEWMYEHQDEYEAIPLGQDKPDSWEMKIHEK